MGIRLALAISLVASVSITLALVALVTVVPVVYRAHPLETAVAVLAAGAALVEGFALVAHRATQ